MHKRKRVIEMAQGLRPHHHEYYCDHVVRVYDKKKNRDEVINVMRCMICGHEDYEYSFEPHTDDMRGERND